MRGAAAADRVRGKTGRWWLLRGRRRPPARTNNRRQRSQARVASKLALLAAEAAAAPAVSRAPLRQGWARASPAPSSSFLRGTGFAVALVSMRVEGRGRGQARVASLARTRYAGRTICATSGRTGKPRSTALVATDGWLHGPAAAAASSIKGDGRPPSRYADAAVGPARARGGADPGVAGAGRSSLEFTAGPQGTWHRSRAT